MEYKYKWYIPDAYLHSRATGYFTKHARFDLMENDKGEPVPMNVGYAVVVESDMDMPVQFSHCDTSQPELTFTTTMVPHITLDRED